MSNDSQLPENPNQRNPSDFPTDFVGFGDDDLRELDETQTQPIDSTKKYGVMEASSAPSEDFESPLTPGIFTNLTMLEKTSMIAIVVALITTAALTILHFNKEIPVDTEIAEKISLPVEGEILSISAFETYWRKPITQGEKPDIVRGGVKLIPTIKIQASGKSGAIRVFFRDGEGDFVGDSTTITISKNETLTISATDGFTDMSMHASYRTGQTPRWIIQILEGPSIDAPIEKFKTLFETEISTDIR